jgi:hypothetical protein
MMASILSAHRFFLCKIQLPVCFAKASITTMEKGEIEKTPRQWGQPEPSQIPPLRSVHPLPVSVAIGNLQGNHGHQNAPPPRLQPPWAEKQLRGTMPFSVHEVDSAGHLDTRMSIGSALITFTFTYCTLMLPSLAPAPANALGLTRLTTTTKLGSNTSGGQWSWLTILAFPSWTAPFPNPQSST